MLLTRRNHLLNLVLCASLLFTSPFSIGRELKFHGPFLQWFDDPSTKVTFSWVERLAPDPQTAGQWQDGPAGFGYGDGDDATVVEGMRGSFPRIFIAKQFTIPTRSKNAPLTLKVDYDDAFIAYINGHQVARSSNIKWAYISAKIKGGHEAGTPEEFTIDSTSHFLKPGLNTISIEGHNVRMQSSDFTLHPSLYQGERAIIPEGATWRYMAGDEAPSRWMLSYPSLDPAEELPKAEESNWTLGIRPRGSGTVYRAVEITDRPFGETDDRVFLGRAENLTPNRSYEYSLAVNGRPVKTGWFRTAPAKQTKPIQFLVGGDMDTAPGIPIYRLAGKLDPLFVLIGGDLAYGNGRAAYRWFDWIDNWTDFVVSPDGRDIPIVAGIGNHELKGLRVRKKDAPFYYTLFDLPNGESNFSLDFGKYMSIVALDSNHSQRVRSQNLWLRTQLAARQDLPHLFTIYHRPAWGTGVKWNSRAIQRNWTPLFEEFGVDCVFENDHHTYKRTYKITDGVRDDENGILHIGDGAWGAHTRPITDRMLSRVGARRYLAEWRAVNHVVQVTAYPDGTKNYEAMTSDGNVFDEYRDNNPAQPKNEPILDLSR